MREVRSTEELDGAFRTLVRGGRRISPPDYDGFYYQLPDGTTIGYRPESSSTP
ncbi:MULTISPECIES: hypothetical protein [Actinosynnema]|uniref:hypothetical protein n=1 Tax=Actinosynnema TaxID=40566 RepID=UPI0020A34AB6|nr:hypothetical protein [Actinosynnema pretiosum]MCP2095983.1 hypothetical protein [Actinosynnema pretiosum]